MKMLRRIQNFTSIVTLTSLVISFVLAGGPNVSATSWSDAPDAEGLQRADYSTPGLMFEANNGQSDKAVKFASRGPGYTLYLTDSAATFSLKVPNNETDITLDKFERAKRATGSDKVQMRFVGAKKNARVSGSDEM